MDPVPDPQLTELLREWQLPHAPATLDRRVLRSRPWWKFLLTGSVRLPVPLIAALALILLLMAAALVRQRTILPTQTSVNLADFQPVRDLNVRIMRGHREQQ